MPRKFKKTSKIDPDATRIILESISDGVFTVDPNWTITIYCEKIDRAPLPEQILQSFEIQVDVPGQSY